MIDPPLSMIEHLKSGKFRGLAVSATTRFPGLPEIPTVQELGIANFDVTAWYALVAPAATPEPVVQRLNAAIGEVLAGSAARDRLMELGAVAKSSSRMELADLIVADIRRWTSGFTAATRQANGDVFLVRSFDSNAEETVFFPRLVGG